MQKLDVVAFRRVGNGGEVRTGMLTVAVVKELLEQGWQVNPSDRFDSRTKDELKKLNPCRAA